MNTLERGGEARCSRVEAEWQRGEEKNVYNAAAAVAPATGPEIVAGWLLMMLLLSSLLTQYGWGEAHAARGILDGLSLPHYYGWRGGPHVKIIPRQKSLHFQECHIPDLWGCLPAARHRIAPFPLSFFSNPNFLSD